MSSDVHHAHDPPSIAPQSSLVYASVHCGGRGGGGGGLPPRKREATGIVEVGSPKSAMEWSWLAGPAVTKKASPV